MKKIIGLLVLLTMELAISGNGQSFLTNGLIAYYPFNGNANDVSGNGNNASVQGNYQYLSDGTLHLIGDNQLYYSGGGYVALPNYGNLNSGFTISIWVGGETDQGDGIYAEYYVWFDNNNGNYVDIGQHDSDIEDQNTTADFPFTVTNYAPWKQLALVYSPSNCAAYLNGALIGSTNIAISPFPMVNSAIGRHWWNGGSNSSARMTMDVKDFRIYNRALATNEVLQLYAYELQPQVGLVKAVIPSFSNLAIGANYQLQVSGDLNTWTNQGAVFTATNSSINYPQYFNVANWNQLFFRLQVP
ncbi:MAG TPA: LamG-like jellyroll fold domain-containing protein [Verrucomicrobiae bacterium]|nr:LamG-like jellyroll fold domain-containing protein [Verrucomicrobiae bacterium]